MDILCDTVAERAVLAGLFKYGSEAWFDIVDMVQESTFTIDSNAMIFKCIKHIFASDDSAKLDIPLIYSAASELGLAKILSTKTEISHLQAIIGLPLELSNVRKFAAKIRKLEITKMLHGQLGIAQDKLLNITGEESIMQILNIAEDSVLDFTTLLNDKDNSPNHLGKNVNEYVEYLANNPVDQMGISTGFPAWDASIGGGLRNGTINIIGARAKIGKTHIGINMGYHIANTPKIDGLGGIPVLNMDTEMMKEDHLHRLLARVSEVPINDIETGKFATNSLMRQNIDDAAKKITKLPLYHKSIAGMPFEDQLAIMRRWITKDVGLNPDGTAKDCVIIYDYLKLMDTKGISSDMKEYQLLGFMMTTLHNFAVRYKIPILMFIQLTRDGINKEDTSVAAGSDRIVWLCSNFTIFKTKSDEEIAESVGGVLSGNRKLVTLAARHGPGMDDRDYINCHMKGWCGKITEGKTAFELKEAHNDEGFVVDDNDDQKDIPFDPN